MRFSLIKDRADAVKYAGIIAGRLEFSGEMPITSQKLQRKYDDTDFSIATNNLMEKRKQAKKAYEDYVSYAKSAAVLIGATIPMLATCIAMAIYFHHSDGSLDHFLIASIFLILVDILCAVGGIFKYRDLFSSYREFSYFGAKVQDIAASKNYYV